MSAWRHLPLNTATVKATGAPVLQAHDLCFGFAQRALFSDFSAQIPPGVTWVCGDESCGKTTLLRLMAGELPASGC